MIKRVAEVLRSSATRGASVERLACAAAFAVYVAFSPFIGFHTLMIIAVSWVFRLSMPLMLVISNVINNPWTFLPVYASDYACGVWLLERLGYADQFASNPTWVVYLNEYLTTTLGMPQVSFWTFMLGGNVLGLFVALCVYPLAKIVIVRVKCMPRTC
jgi:uncharacterized protein (DUF2062 family)